MKIRHLLAFMLLIPFAAGAQMGGNGMMGRGGGGGGFGRAGGRFIPVAAVTGRLVDSAGNPIKGATLVLQQQDIDAPAGQAAAPGAPYYKELTTKKNGKFNFSDLKPFHKYKLSIMAEGYRRMEKDINYSGSRAEKTGDELQDSLSLSLPSRKISSTQKDFGDIHLILIQHQPS
jgi:hypothetical protein